MVYPVDFIKEIAHFKSCKLSWQFPLFFTDFGLKSSTLKVNPQSSTTGRSRRWDREEWMRSLEKEDG
jgi:hypothetical protein